MRVAVAVSGGMDSLLAMALLREQGHAVMAVHGLFLPDASEDAPGVRALRKTCQDLGIPLHVLDLRESFRSCVTDVFLSEYRAGRTPNPCALCNPHIKFGSLWDGAARLGAEALATGHYVRLDESGVYGVGRLLLRGVDPAKDQSYFLALVEPARLERAVFPLGEMRKADVPGELERRGLRPVHSGESQEICFIPDDDYRAWLAARDADLPGPGPMLVLDPGKEQEVGRHGGLWRYTQGQRRGLGVAWSEPLYVVRKDSVRNALILGTREQLLCRGCETGPATMAVPIAQWPETVWVQMRYRQRAEAARVTALHTGLRIELFRSGERPAPGQVAVVYDAAGRVLGAGNILRSLENAEPAA